MKCLYCGCTDSRVIDSRPTDEGSAIRRRRECTNCNRRFTTYEKIEEIPIMVVKKDGRREPYDGDKVLNGIRKACEKRPIPSSEVERVADEVTRQVFNSLDQEITSEKIGGIIMQQLKELDDVAYVRFASVYRQFKDIDAFMEEMRLLLAEKESK
ncbi:MAG: transcriptional regulator NrdR [Christensenellales bacterium]